jgi:NADPH-dependent 2,4-dienoyl-CoA reductase/sulfur reductase-like enzyme
MWVLYTQPWHAEAAFDLRRRGHPVKFREMDRNAVGRLLELDKSEEFVDPQAHVVTAKKQELVH